MGTFRPTPRHSVQPTLIAVFPTERRMRDATTQLRATSSSRLPKRTLKQATPGPADRGASVHTGYAAREQALLPLQQLARRDRQRQVRMGGRSRRLPHLLEEQQRGLMRTGAPRADSMTAQPFSNEAALTN